ncbi:hypothetical protein SOCE26_078640 [Sorangium cellulosum]|uniref:Lipoprotein n=2 Tax=Sorangium cellulosum TaxID=56 RepID=A0A2L0F450_SORCE|nr:hypothetical protein SOCE26_078640 [Sorangium cellulosum]
MMVTGRPLGSAMLLALAAAALGCGGGKEPEFADDPPADAGPPPQPITSVPPPQDAGVPTPAVPTTAACDGVQSLAMTTMFQGRAPGEAPRMQMEGAPVCGVVPEGQTVSGQTFMLQPGNCYTFLAQALPTVTEVDLQLELDLNAGGQPALAAFNLKPVLAVDSDTGPTAAIGAKQSCYQWPFPLPGTVKLVVKARTGSGPVAAQAYSRKK